MLPLFELFGVRIAVTHGYLVFLAAITLFSWTNLPLALILFVSIMLHEAGHAIAAGRFGCRTRSIVMHAFGGVAAIEDLADLTPRQLLIVALAGPIVSFLLAGLALATHAFLPAGWVQLSSVLSFVGYGNAVVGAFNLLPIYPMDGGQAVHAVATMALGQSTRASWVTLVVSSLTSIAVVAGFLAYGLLWSALIVLGASIVGFLMLYSRIRTNGILVSQGMGLPPS